ncbi:L-aspartate oxidase [Lederbergia sp. NSJ-179]|uniref:L-aspartate oxidase n=1 Tax=Lederbergia sp. NSJ-179 TaxID=2931402 RepID=UPI001FD0BF6A|nr:L-aspartate oxidase [Lederbergia sp. NSJ-179]MCJ7841106.1 L-aspartate oxidase [Lederbergia sp. NSJ-179]
MRQTDVLIIGSGVAAFQLARKLRSDINVMIITKSHMKESNSYLAQGGIAAALGEQDDSEKHFHDTLAAGRYHNNPDAVRKLTATAPSVIKTLVQQGCPFDKDAQGKLLLGMEGAHSENRIVHGGGDATGKTIMDFLISQRPKNVEVIENSFVYEILVENNTCIGVKAKNEDNQIDYFLAHHVVLATGGCGQLYRYTSNAETVTGDGIALAYLAGAEIADMEFIQFHPTLLYAGGKTCGLVSEAVRGEGGRLITEDGKAIMKDVHPLADLAPRHIVSQTIYEYLSHGEQIYLDISPVKDFSSRFPTISDLCRKNGIDLKEKRIPVVPGSHFLMGGIQTDLVGRSSIQSLYALGEVACTGIHGANRLASNSLLEGLFMGENLARWLNTQSFSKSHKLPVWREPSENRSIKDLPDLQELKKAMMDHAGIVRTRAGLMSLINWLERFGGEQVGDGNLDHMQKDTLTRMFMLITASLIAKAALQRRESRGGHYRQDFPCEKNHGWQQKQIIHCRKKEKGKVDEQIKVATIT